MLCDNVEKVAATGSEIKKYSKDRPCIRCCCNLSIYTKFRLCSPCRGAIDNERRAKGMEPIDWEKRKR